MKYRINTLMKKLLMMVTLGSFLSLSVQAPVMAAMVSTGEITANAELSAQKDEIRSLLARDDVRNHLQKYGVSEADLEQRINSMTAEEIQSFNAQLNDMPAGEGVLGTIIAVIVIFMLLDIAGVTDIFPGI